MTVAMYDCCEPGNPNHVAAGKTPKSRKADDAVSSQSCTRAKGEDGLKHRKPVGSRNATEGGAQPSTSEELCICRVSRTASCESHAGTSVTSAEVRLTLAL
jgi:hypothetical protein